MNLIHKQVIHPWISSYEIPRGADIIKVDWQGDDICIWYSFNIRDRDSLQTRNFQAVPTGTQYDEKMTYVGTAVSKSLVFHLFEF